MCSREEDSPHEQLFSRIEKYLDENYIFRCGKQYKGWWGRLNARLDSEHSERLEKEKTGEHFWHPDIFASGPNSYEYYYKQYLEQHKKDNFSTNMMRLIMEKGLDHVDVYKKARIDRRLFSKIRCNYDYLPSKRTVFALAIGIGLDLEETNLLLRYAGYTISNYILLDMLMQFFIQNRIYDMEEINAALVKYKLEPF